MKNSGQANLRTRLRADTRVSHERLDKMVSKFDLATPDGLGRFLGMQSQTLQALAVPDVSAKTNAVICDLQKRAEQDLFLLGASAQVQRRHEIDPLHPLAIEYALAGSRLGSQILKKRWQASTHPQVRRASAYFSAPSYIGMWTSFCKITETLPSGDPMADQIVRDADRIFDLYWECARALQLMEGAIDA